MTGPLKRVFDVFGAVLGLLLLAPVMVAIALLIRWHMGGPVLFRQTRPGLHGKPFTLLKFRTMRDNPDPQHASLTDAQRLTRLGRMVRAASLDELPQLWNVLRGDMSLVGPRPLLMQYLPLYSPAQARRHDMRPGITGWAQVNGRNAISWDQKFAFDVWYVDHHSLWLDLRILWMTLAKVLRRDGITAKDGATPSPFTGNPP